MRSSVDLMLVISCWTLLTSCFFLSSSVSLMLLISCWTMPTSRLSCSTALSSAIAILIVLLAIAGEPVVETIGPYLSYFLDLKATSHEREQKSAREEKTLQCTRRRQAVGHLPSLVRVRHSKRVFQGAWQS